MKENNYYKKQNFIELRTLEYYLSNGLLAKSIFDMRHKLSPIWFEKYIQYRMNKIWYKMDINTWWNKADGWIDLKWFYKWIPVFVQCKKYIKNKNFRWIVWVSEIRDFFWGVYDEIKRKNYCNFFMIYVTTWSFTKDAKIFARRNNIKLCDYKDLARVSLEYPLENFYNEIGNTSYIINKNFDNQTCLMEYTFDELSSDDLFQYYKNIRDYIANNIIELEENTWFETFSDTTLKSIARKRIKNLSSLKTFEKSIPYYSEKVNLNEFASELVRSFNIIS